MSDSDPDLPRTPALPPLGDVVGIRTIPPPASILEAAAKMVTESFAQLPPGTNNALVPIFHVKNGKVAGNLGVMNRFNDHARVVGWIAKDWGEPVSAGGARVFAS